MQTCVVKMDVIKILRTLICSVLLFRSVPGLAHASANDFMVGELRVDLPEVYNSWDFMSEIYSQRMPTCCSAPETFNAVWLSVDLNAP